ncbi:MAG: energy transducer TonB [Bacteroidaceae bacterium]|nr:energy transducer TonB [Bacteroidaceae bacterium]
MPDWKPGTQRGQAVNVKFNIPIFFRLDGAKGNEGEEESDIRVVGYNKENIKAVYSEPREEVSASTSDDEVFQVVENMPEFPGGTAELMKFLAMNIKYPVEAQKENVQGRVVVQFVVSKTGKIIDPTIARSVSPELDAEAIRVVNAMPLWTPGEQKGEPVNVKFTLPILFRLTDNKK